MHRPTLRAAILTATVVLAVGAVAGCGSDDPESSTAVTSAPDSAEGDSGDGEATEPAAEDVALPDDVCTLLSPEDVSTAVGATVTIEPGPGGDCAFSEEDPRGISGVVGVVRDAATNGGYEGYLTGVSGVLTDPRTRDLDGLSGTAVVYTGVPGFGGSTQVMSGAVVDRGTFLVQATASQASDLTADRMAEVAEALVRLLDAQLG